MRQAALRIVTDIWAPSDAVSAARARPELEIAPCLRVEDHGLVVPAGARVS